MSLRDTIDRARSAHDAERHEAFLAVLDQMATVQAALDVRQAQLEAALRPPEVLFSGTLQIPAAGFIARQWRYPGATAAIRAAANPLTVVAGPAGSAAPPYGPGVHLLSAGRGQSIAIAGTQLTVWGTPNDLIGIQIFTKVQAPTFGTT